MASSPMVSLEQWSHRPLFLRRRRPLDASEGVNSKPRAPGLNGSLMNHYCTREPSDGRDPAVLACAFYEALAGCSKAKRKATVSRVCGRCTMQLSPFTDGGCRLATRPGGPHPVVHPGHPGTSGRMQRTTRESTPDALRGYFCHFAQGPVCRSRG